MRFHPGTRWPAREPTASVPCPSQTEWHASVPFGFPARSSRAALLRRSGCPSDDRLHGEERVEARIDLLAEDRDLAGSFDAQAHLTVIQPHHRHDDPIADHDPLTEFARQDEHGGLLPWWLRPERLSRRPGGHGRS